METHTSHSGDEATVEEDLGWKGPFGASENCPILRVFFFWEGLMRVTRPHVQPVSGAISLSAPVSPGGGADGSGRRSRVKRKHLLFLESLSAQHLICSADP